ncbi:MAG: hypothetical protein NDJ94_01950 [Vicinamibacteria bacterium]|nr:hypothetical protein [Vicinamibacteria bacterium]
MRPAIPFALLFAAAPLAAESPAPQDAFWTALRGLCGQAFAGQMVEGTAPGDAAIGAARLVMHVRACTESEIRIPFHVGDDRSRTWVLTRSASGLRLKHDHRHADGTPDAVTQYGGDTAAPGTAQLQEFPADAFTGQLLPVSATNVWSFELLPGDSFSYGLRREGRRFRVRFDLKQPVPAPPAPWGE